MSIRWRGKSFHIRYYGPDGRQHEEAVGPNRKEAETVLHQRLYESRVGKYPILAKRTRTPLASFVEEWKSKHLARVRASTAKRYRELLAHQLLPTFGGLVLSAITLSGVESFRAHALERGLAPKTVNHATALLKQLLDAAVDWGYLPASSIAKLKKLRVPRPSLALWTPREIRRFLLVAPEPWRSVFIVAVFTGLRPGEIQAMRWTEQNWPDFAANKIHVTASYEARSKVLGAPKTDRSVRDVDMVPIVRQVLEALPSRAAGAWVFPAASGAMLPRTNMRRAWEKTIAEAKVRPISLYTARHTFASLLIAAGKNPLYVSRQMGHHSPGFTLTVYGHLMDSGPARYVEWIDQLVFPEGLKRALTVPLDSALRDATGCNRVQQPEWLKPNADAVPGIVVQSSATECMVEAAGIEPAFLLNPAASPALPRGW